MLSDYDVFNRHHISFDVVIKLLSPLSHIGETVGNQSNLRTSIITDLEGINNHVFVYSGNALRNGILRRKGVESFLEQLKISINPTVHQTLFAGGFIDGGTACDLELDKQIRQLIPPVSVLGTAKPKGVFNNKNAQMIGGRMAVGDAVLVCWESAEYIYKHFPPAIPSEALLGLAQVVKAKDNLHDTRIEAWLKKEEQSPSMALEYKELIREWMPFLEEKLRPHTQWLTWNQKVRMDSLKSPDLQGFLEKEESKQQLSLFPESSLSEEKKSKSQKKETKQQMIMGDWLVQQGATLYSRWSANITAIEEGFIADALLKFAESPYLGGKSATGCGLISMDVYATTGGKSEHWLHISPSSQLVGDRAKMSHQRYLSYLDEYRKYLEELTNSDIKQFLGL